MTIVVSTVSDSAFSAITDFTALQEEILDWSHRDGDTAFAARIPAFITLAEAEMQIRCRLVEFEATASITVTDGVGTLPTDFAGARSIYWDGDTKLLLTYVAPELFDSLRNGTDGDPGYYTISGTTLRVDQEPTGTAVTTYNARFSPLTDTNTSNTLLASHPDAYLYGALKHASAWAGDDAGLQKFGTMFNAACDRINVNNDQRKYGNALAVRAR